MRQQARPREAPIRPETLELPRVLGTARRSTEPPRVRISFMDRVTVGHNGRCRQLLSPPHRDESSPDPTRLPGCGPGAGRHLATTNHTLHKPQPPQTTVFTNHNLENVRGVAVVKFPTEAPPVIAGDSRHRHPVPFPG
jgi:hypothetical protein